LVLEGLHEKLLDKIKFGLCKSSFSKIHFNITLSLSLSPPLAPQPSLGLGLLCNLLPLKMAEFLGGFSTIFFFTG
jgi:hypothetical protein